jgi:hypothetical protein
VGCPTRVCETEVPLETAFTELSEFIDFAFLSGYLDLPVALDRHAGRVITAIFQSFQCFDKDWVCIVFAQIADYSTHRSPPRAGFAFV